MKVSIWGYEMPAKAVKRKIHRVTGMVFSTEDEKKVGKRIRVLT